ncbi:MAG: rod-binding protein [Burkholderiaceae bacterium]
MSETGAIRSAMDFQGLGQLRAQAAQTKDAASNPALRKAAEQFEAMFLQVMIKTMREATASNEEGDLMGSSTTKTYEALFDQEIAQEMSKKGGVGLADMLVKSFERNQPGQVHVDPSADPATAEVLAGRAALLRDSAQKGLPLAEKFKNLPLNAEQAAGFALPKARTQLPVDLNKLMGGHR